MLYCFYVALVRIYMDRKRLLSILSFVFLLSTTSVCAIGLDKPPSLEELDNPKTVESTEHNPLYPAKYTPEYIKEIKGKYNGAAKDEVFCVALDILTGTNGEYSQKAILGDNLSGKTMKIQFKDLGTINKDFDTFDALGWKKGSRLYIFINEKHEHSPAVAIAALLSHEALHQDEYNSLAEETYAWTMEAAVWTELQEKYPGFNHEMDSLVLRENTLEKMFEKGNYTDKYIKKTVYSNPSYQNLPESSPGFEAL